MTVEQGLPFPAPNKTTVLANAADVVVWEGLPDATTMISYHSETGSSAEWVVNGGVWEAAFHPHGIYTFVLKADGYETSVVEVIAEYDDGLE